MNLSDKDNKAGKYIFVLSVMLIVSAIFLQSFYWAPMGTQRKIAIIGLTFLSVILVPLFTIRIRMFNVFWERILEYFSGIFEKAKKCKFKMIRTLSIILACVLFLCLISFLVSKFVFGTLFNVKLLYTLLALFFLALGIVVLWKNSVNKPEKIFVVVALIMGIFCIGVTPDRAGVSWDDEIHYRHTLEISNVFNGIMYTADIKNIEDYAANIYGHTGYDSVSDTQYKSELENSYKAKESVAHDFKKYGVWSIAYIPAAVGILFARGLGMSYTAVFNMGRIFNLVSYIILIYYSMKRIERGKLLVALIGLIPTSVFMASSYSYDWWVTGFTILSFAYFYAELQEDTPLDNKNMVIMIGAMMLGCMPKAIYFPLLFPLLFMPKRKFKSSKQRRWYYLLVVGAGLLLVASFLLPRLIGGFGTGDSRGGEGVNSTEQLSYILHNPLAYAKTLLLFLKDYLSFKSAGSMLQRFAYVGEGKLWGIVSLMMIVLTFADSEDSYKKNGFVRVASLFGCTVALILSTTALYISFTAVAADTVAGMQGRYLVPLIFPGLYSLGINGIRCKINKNALVCIFMFIVSITFICNMFSFCVVGY